MRTPRRIGSHSLCEFPLDVVPVECLRCARTGSYRRDSLVARFGADIALPDREIFAASTRSAREGTPAIAEMPCQIEAELCGLPTLPASPQARPTHAQAFRQRTTFRTQHTTTTQFLLRCHHLLI